MFVSTKKWILLFIVTYCLCILASGDQGDSTTEAPDNLNDTYDDEDEVLDDDHLTPEAFEGRVPNIEELGHDKEDELCHLTDDHTVGKDWYGLKFELHLKHHLIISLIVFLILCVVFGIPLYYRVQEENYKAQWDRDHVITDDLCYLMKGSPGNSRRQSPNPGSRKQSGVHTNAQSDVHSNLGSDVQPSVKLSVQSSSVQSDVSNKDSSSVNLKKPKSGSVDSTTFTTPPPSSPIASPKGSRMSK